MHGQNGRFVDSEQIRLAHAQSPQVPQCPYPGREFPSNVCHLGSHPWVRREVYAKDLHAGPSSHTFPVVIEEVGGGGIALQFGDE